MQQAAWAGCSSSRQQVVSGGKRLRCNDRSLRSHGSRTSVSAARSALSTTVHVLQVPALASLPSPAPLPPACSRPSFLLWCNYQP